MRGHFDARVLVVGGAGYIGSHMAMILVQSGHEVIILCHAAKEFCDVTRKDCMLRARLVHM
jgi:UDP-glucose 4-epimerase